MNATFGTISSRMRLNLFSQGKEPEREQESPEAVPDRTGKTFPADEVAWGITIRNGYDELDDPWYHRGLTQHAYLEGSDSAAICGFRPPQTGTRSRRRARLGMPTAGVHPMCGTCARMVVAPRPRVPVPVEDYRPLVAVPVAAESTPPPAEIPVTVAPKASISFAAVATPSNGAAPTASAVEVAQEPAAAPQAPPAASSAPPVAAPPPGLPPPPPGLPPPPRAAVVSPADGPVAPSSPEDSDREPASAWAQRIESDELDPEQAAGSGLMTRGVSTEPDDVERPADEESADEPTADGQTADQESADEESADEPTADGQTADQESADEQSADGQTADQESADEPTADGQTADQESADAESVDRG